MKQQQQVIIEHLKNVENTDRLIDTLIYLEKAELVYLKNKLKNTKATINKYKFRSEKKVNG